MFSAELVFFMSVLFKFYCIVLTVFFITSILFDFLYFKRICYSMLCFELDYYIGLIYILLISLLNYKIVKNNDKKKIVIWLYICIDFDIWMRSNQIIFWSIIKCLIIDLRPNENINLNCQISSTVFAFFLRKRLLQNVYLISFNGEFWDKIFLA